METNLLHNLRILRERVHQEVETLIGCHEGPYEEARIKGRIEALTGR